MRNLRNRCNLQVSRYRPARQLTESMRYGLGPVPTPCCVSAMSFSARAQKFPDRPGVRPANSFEVSRTKKHKVFLENNLVKTGENYSFDWRIQCRGGGRLRQPQGLQGLCQASACGPVSACDWAPDCDWACYASLCLLSGHSGKLNSLNGQ